MEKSRGRQAAGLSQGELPGSRAYLRTGAPALSQIVSHRRRSLSGVVVMCNPQGEKGPSQQPCPGVTVFPDQINYFLSPRAYQSFWRYSLYLPTFPSFSLLSLCPRGGLGADRALSGCRSCRPPSPRFHRPPLGGAAARTVRDQVAALVPRRPLPFCNLDPQSEWGRWGEDAWGLRLPGCGVRWG